jgi:hypothetical protein
VGANGVTVSPTTGHIYICGNYFGADIGAYTQGAYSGAPAASSIAKYFATGGALQGFVASVNSSGTARWSSPISSRGAQQASASSIDVEYMNDTIVVGGKGLTNTFLYNANATLTGSFVWTITNITTATLNYGTVMRYTSDGAVIVATCIGAGSATLTAGSDLNTSVCYDQYSSNVIACTQFAGAANTPNLVTPSDSSHYNAIVSKNTSGFSQGVAFAKFDPYMRGLWLAEMVTNGSLLVNQASCAVACDPLGDLVAVGAYPQATTSYYFDSAATSLIAANSSGVFPNISATGGYVIKISDNVAIRGTVGVAGSVKQISFTNNGLHNVRVELDFGTILDSAGNVVYRTLESNGQIMEVVSDGTYWRLFQDVEKVVVPVVFAAVNSGIKFSNTLNVTFSRTDTVVSMSVPKINTLPNSDGSFTLLAGLLRSASGVSTTTYFPIVVVPPNMMASIETYTVTPTVNAASTTWSSGMINTTVGTNGLINFYPSIDPTVQFTGTTIQTAAARASWEPK